MAFFCKYKEFMRSLALCDFNRRSLRSIRAIVVTPHFHCIKHARTFRTTWSSIVYSKTLVTCKHETGLFNRNFRECQLIFFTVHDKAADNGTLHQRSSSRHYILLALNFISLHIIQAIKSAMMMIKLNANMLSYDAIPIVLVLSRFPMA